MEKRKLIQKLNGMQIKAEKWRSYMSYQYFIRNQGVNDLYREMDVLCGIVLEKQKEKKFSTIRI